MDFNAAIASHTKWKIHFRTAIAKREELDAAFISSHRSCDFGKWLHGEAEARFGATPEHRRVVQAHTAFHELAGQVAASINQHRYTEATRLLGSEQFREASTSVATSVIALRKIAGR